MNNKKHIQDALGNINFLLVSMPLSESEIRAALEDIRRSLKLIKL